MLVAGMDEDVGVEAPRLLLCTPQAFECKLSEKSQFASELQSEEQKHACVDE